MLRERLKFKYLTLTGQDSDESFQIMGNDGGIEDGVMYRRGGDNVSDMQTVSNAVDIFRGWLKEKNFQTAFEMFSTEDLFEKLNQFRNESTLSGSKMETLSMMKDSLVKYIASFKGVPETVIMVQLEPALNLQDSYRGSQSTKVSKKTPMTITDLIQLHRSQLLSVDTPVSLFRKVWFDVSLHLGCCGQDAMRQLHARSFILESDEYGRKYYRLNEDINDAKTRSRHEMQCWNWKGRMYEVQDDPNCPVKSLTLYLNKRNQHNEAFFQRHKVGFSPTDNEWYEAAPLGHCVLARIMSVMSEEAGLSKIYTNTSLRLTAASFLDDYQLDTHRILGVHPRYKSVKGLRRTVKQSSDVLHKDSTALHNIMYCS